MNRRDFLQAGVILMGSRTLTTPSISAENEEKIISVDVITVRQYLEEQARKKGFGFHVESVDDVPLIAEINSRGEVFRDLNFAIQNRGGLTFLPLNQPSSNEVISLDSQGVSIETVTLFRHWQRVIWFALSSQEINRHNCKAI